MWKKLTYLCSFVLVLGLLLTNAGKAADPSLVGWWKFDDASGTTAIDYSGHGHYGAVNGANWVGVVQ